MAALQSHLTNFIIIDDTSLSDTTRTIEFSWEVDNMVSGPPKLNFTEDGAVLLVTIYLQLRAALCIRRFNAMTGDLLSGVELNTAGLGGGPLEGTCQ
jgi:hypothetical protein